MESFFKRRSSNRINIRVPDGDAKSLVSLSGKARRAFYQGREDRDPLAGVKFITPDMSAWDIPTPKARDRNRSYQPTTAAKTVAAVPLAGTAFSKALKPSVKKAPFMGTTGVRGPVKSTSYINPVLSEKSPKGGRLFEGRVSPTAREATRPSMLNLGVPRSAKSERFLSREMKSPGVHTKPKASERLRQVPEAEADCVPRPEGTTDNKHGRKSAAFVPWCK